MKFKALDSCFVVIVPTCTTETAQPPIALLGQEMELVMESLGVGAGEVAVARGQEGKVRSPPARATPSLAPQPPCQWERGLIFSHTVCEALVMMKMGMISKS